MAKCGKDHKILMEIAEDQGFTIRTTGKSHFQVRNAEGRVIAVCPGTASDHRSILNFRSDLRRGGVVLP